jgi:hypothetical protein
MENFVAMKNFSLPSTVIFISPQDSFALNSFFFSRPLLPSMFAEKKVFHFMLKF